MMVGVNCQSESNFVRLNTFIGQNETERQQMKIEEAIKCAVGVVVIARTFLGIIGLSHPAVSDQAKKCADGQPY